MRILPIPVGYFEFSVETPTEKSEAQELFEVIASNPQLTGIEFSRKKGEIKRMGQYRYQS
jgi:hypothetical protein